MEILNHEEVPQGSTQWFEARRGLATGSRFGKIATPRTGKLSTGHKAVIAECLAELVDYDSESRATNYWMERGLRMEPEARAFYELQAGCEVEEVGLVIGDSPFGYSPDGFVGDQGMIEIKCPAPKTHVLYLLGDEIPDTYKPQVYGGLAVCEREWCDFISYCPGFDPFVVRATISDPYYPQFLDTLGEFADAYHSAKTRVFGDDTSG